MSQLPAPFLCSGSETEQFNFCMTFLKKLSKVHLGHRTLGLGHRAAWIPVIAQKYPGLFLFTSYAIPIEIILQFSPK